MLKSVRVKFSNGALVPLEPLDFAEGEEILLTLNVEPDHRKGISAETPSLLEMFQEIRDSVPASAWDDVPTDAARNYKHYLYGWPKEDER